MDKEKVEFLGILEKVVIQSIDHEVSLFARDYREDNIGGIQRDWPSDIQYPYDSKLFVYGEQVCG